MYFFHFCLCEALVNVTRQSSRPHIEVTLLIKLGQDNTLLGVLRVVYYLRRRLRLILQTIEHFSAILCQPTLHRIGLYFVRPNRIHSLFVPIDSHYRHRICVIDAE